MSVLVGRVGLVIKGAWDSSVAYESMNVVTYNNSTYIAKQAVPAGTLPTNTTYWELTLDASLLQTKTMSSPVIIGGESKTTVEAAVGALEDVKADKTTISYRNLLDNPWFTVNQREFSSDTFESLTYFADRWTGLKSVTWSSGGITLAPNNGDASLRQTFKLADCTEWLNKTLTCSALLSDGTIISGSQNIGDLSDTVTFFNDDSSGLRSVILKSSGKVIVQFATYKSIAIRAVKLENGNISTLAFDTPPEYTLELIKCQRYFKRIKEGAIGLGLALSTTGAVMFISQATYMQADPTITTLGTISIGSGTVTAVSMSSGQATNNLDMQLTLTSSGLTADKVSRVIIASGGYIDLSADL